MHNLALYRRPELEMLLTEFLGFGRPLVSPLLCFGLNTSSIFVFPRTEPVQLPFPTASSSHGPGRHTISECRLSYPETASVALIDITAEFRFGDPRTHDPSLVDPRHSSWREDAINLLRSARNAIICLVAGAEHCDDITFPSS
jgi:hypothetical protein